MRFVHTLIFRVLIASCLLLLALFALFTWLALQFQKGQMTTLVLDSASRISDIVRTSTRYSMLLNRREDVYQIITTIGREPGVEGIRIYNKRGEIMFSTDKTEQGQVVNMNAEACYACHERERPLESLPIANRARIYTTENHRVVGHINPIRNEPACSEADCHAHAADRKVLGVLDVRLSLAKVDAEIARSRRQLIAYWAVVTLTVMVASGLFLFFSVHRPVRELMVGTEQISSGHLEYRLAARTHDEIGELARAFNKMAVTLEKAEKENRSWSQTLEMRVQQKSAELRQVHDQMLQIEKMASLGKLSATVAHELNNPLEGILTHAKLIRRRLQRAESPDSSMLQPVEDLDLIIREVQRCGNIVKNLLLFSKRQVGEFGMHPVGEIVDKAVQLMQHHFKISNVELNIEIAGGDLSLMCDENQMQQALVALFVNAVEAMKGGGRLTVKADRNDAGYIRVRVSDTGIGIARDDLPRVFEPFFSTKKEGKGVGLGLSVVYGIVERHGGAVSVDSEPGKGTEFTLLFPPAESRHPRVETRNGEIARAVEEK